jgi:hypothetical protein
LDEEQDQREIPIEEVEPNKRMDQQQKKKETIETGWGTLDDDRKNYKCENGVETLTFPQVYFFIFILKIYFYIIYI